jgi:subtilisin family serine protease
MVLLDLVKLTPLIKLSQGRPDVKIGLIDGPVVTNHPELAQQNIQIADNGSGTCTQANSLACLHGTFVAGILSAKRGSAAPAICPDCTLLIHPIFTETGTGSQMPRTSPQKLAEAILKCIESGARCINLSLALAQPTTKGEQELEQVLDYAAKRGVLIVAAAGNQGTLGSSAITRHPWVISVVACDLQGRPTRESNLSNSIGRHGLRAPGEAVTSLGVNGKPLTLGGTSAATPFVTGAIALLWSIFPTATASSLKLALMPANGSRRTSVVPPLLDAWSAYQVMASTNRR